jgi:hypothetical protein
MLFPDDVQRLGASSELAGRWFQRLLVLARH